MEGGTLLDTIRQRGHLTEEEASSVVRDVASGLFRARQGHCLPRSKAGEHSECAHAGELTPGKICDFDLGILAYPGILSTAMDSQHRKLLPPVGSADFMVI